MIKFIPLIVVSDGHFDALRFLSLMNFAGDQYGHLSIVSICTPVLLCFAAHVLHRFFARRVYLSTYRLYPLIRFYLSFAVGKVFRIVVGITVSDFEL